MTSLRPLTRLLGRIALLATPLVFVFLLYLVFDPFKTLRHHESFYEPHDPVTKDRDFVSTEEFLRLKSTRPNSFIFGSSRSLAFHCDEWRRYLPDDARPFHFDAWLESVYGVWRKALFLDAEGMELRDVLFVFDNHGFEQTTNSYSHLFMKHPRLSGEPAFVFQAVQAASFYHNLFFLKYLDFRLFGTLRPYMLDAFTANWQRQQRDTNDLVFQGYEDELHAGEDRYYEHHRAEFTERHPSDSLPMLGPPQLAELEETARIFRKHGTRVRVIVSPLYGQARLAASDRAELERLFGKGNVFDFSGKNAFTDNPRNFYESSHYRPHVAVELLRLAYGARAAAN